MCSLICVAKVVDKGMVPLVSVMTGLLWVSVLIISFVVNTASSHFSKMAHHQLSRHEVQRPLPVVLHQFT